MICMYCGSTKLKKWRMSNRYYICTNSNCSDPQFRLGKTRTVQSGQILSMNTYGETLKERRKSEMKDWIISELQVVDYNEKVNREVEGMRDQINLLYGIFPLKNDNYLELLFAEFGKRFKNYDWEFTPQTLNQKGHLEKYNVMGPLFKRVRCFCDKCQYEFAYIYRGGPKRGLCPACTDWTKKYPNDDIKTYECLHLGGN